MTPYIEHIAFGLMFAGTGAGAKCLCPSCQSARIVLTILLVLIEAAVTVTVIG